MPSIFSFLRRRRRRAETLGGEAPAEPATAETLRTAASEAPMRRALMANNDPPLDQISDMLNVLSTYLPASVPSLPNPSVSAVSVTERAVGLGNRRGNETRGPFAIVALKGGRLDAVVRFQLWANEPSDADTAIDELHGRLFAARDELWGAGFLRVTAEKTSLPEHVSSPNAWRKTADYRILYEFHYQDTEGADSLIARIPIHIDSTYAEATIVTDEIIRWDNEAAPALVVRGCFSIGRLSALAFVPGTLPSGSITLTRTFDGAVGSPTGYPTLTDFLMAVAGPASSERHGQMTFSSLSDFLTSFNPAGDSVKLGDWDEDGNIDIYEPLVLDFDPGIHLPGKSDRFEVSFQHDAFDQIAIIYFRAIH